MAVIRPALPSLAFTMVPNAWLRDPDLPPGPKAYLAYLLSHEAGYKCSTSQAAREMGVGRDTVAGWNRKLLERGYFLAVRQTRAGGRWGENDYTITDCTSTIPPLPVDPSLFALAGVGKPTVSDLPGTVEPGTVNPPRRRTQGEEPPPTEEGAPALRAVSEEHDAVLARAQVLAAEHYEATGKLGGNRVFLAVRALIAECLEAGHPCEQVRPVLAHLRQRGRPITRATLGPLLADPRLMAAPPGGHAPYRNPPPGSYTDTAF